MTQKFRASERDELKKRISELEEENLLLKDEVADWKKQYHSLQKEKDNFEKTAKEENLKRSETAEALRQANTAREAVEKLLERNKEMMALEVRAREGQVRKVRIMEHDLKTTKEDNDKLEKQRNYAEAKRKDFEMKWLRERSLRLQDIHKNHNITVENKKTMQLKSAADEVMTRALKDRKEMAHSLDVNLLALEAQAKIAEKQNQEIEDQSQEIERLKGKILNVERLLHQRDESLTTSAINSKHLEGEVWRMQHQLMSSASANGLNSMKGHAISKQLTAALAKRTAQSEFLSREAAASCRPGVNLSSQTFITAVDSNRIMQPRTVHLLPGDSIQSNESHQKGLRKLPPQAALESLSFGSSVGIPFKSSASVNAKGRDVSASSLLSLQDYDRNNISNNAGIVSQQARSTDDMYVSLKNRKLIPAEQALKPQGNFSMSGSIYIGYGLGLKKSSNPVYEFKTGSAKQSLKTVLNSNNHEDTSWN